MNREEAKALLPIITAFADGKDVQIRRGDSWVSDEIFAFVCTSDFYRIKPETMECWVAVDRDGERFIFNTKGEAEEEIQDGSYAPYTIHHMREVED